MTVTPFKEYTGGCKMKEEKIRGEEFIKSDTYQKIETKAYKIFQKPLSEILTLAINDMKKIAKDKRYKLFMGNWHERLDSEYRKKQDACYVCMAGSVLAKTLKYPIKQNYNWGGCGRYDYVSDLLTTIEHLRTGKFKNKEGRTEYYKPIWDNSDVLNMPYKHITKYRKFVKVLKEKGL